MEFSREHREQTGLETTPDAEHAEQATSPSRRQFVKKAAYVAPTLTILNILSSVEQGYAAQSLPGPPDPPGPMYGGQMYGPDGAPYDPYQTRDPWKR